MKNRIVNTVWVTAFIIGALHLFASTVIHIPHAIASLSDRWQWAIEKVKEIDEPFWIGYSFKRLMNRYSTIGCTNSEEQTTLREILYPEKSDSTAGHILTPQEAARKALNAWARSAEDTLVTKEIAILLHYDKQPLNDNNLKNIRMCDLSGTVDLKGYPVIWLGDSDSEESISLLTNIYVNNNHTKIKKEIVSAVGVHPNNRKAFSFLTQVVKSNDEDEIRKNAVFWIGQQNSREALSFLKSVIKEDPSKHVREHTVFALSQIRLEEATDNLIALARNANETNIRKQAIFWLSQKASKKAADTIAEVVYEDHEIDVQEHAIFALSQLRDNEGIPGLIKIAKTHTSIQLRKKAIFWLGQSDDPKALEAIIDLARQ